MSMFAAILKCFIGRMPIIGRFYNWLVDLIFFSFIMRLFLESYLELLVAALLNVREMHFWLDGEAVASVFAIVNAVGYIALPIVAY